MSSVVCVFVCHCAALFCCVMHWALVASDVVVVYALQTWRWSYDPSTDVRAPCGYVGLLNPGCTCYCNAVLQQLFMTRQFRSGLLRSCVPLVGSTDAPAEGDDNRLLLTQLQTLFGFLEASQRRAFSPTDFLRSFKVRQRVASVLCVEQRVLCPLPCVMCPLVVSQHATHLRVYLLASVRASERLRCTVSRVRPCDLLCCVCGRIWRGGLPTCACSRMPTSSSRCSSIDWRAACGAPRKPRWWRRSWAGA